jgi:uncharacterized protein
MASTLVVNVLDLLRRAGATKDVRVVVPAELFEFADDRIDEASDVAVNVHLESGTGGIVATGDTRVAWSSQCRRCLRPVAGESRSELHEIFARAAGRAETSLVDPDALALVGDQIDFAPVVREVVLLGLPLAPLCRPDCPGLCPRCGADLATDPCTCVVRSRDERWAALDDLIDPLE